MGTRMGSGRDDVRARLRVEVGRFRERERRRRFDVAVHAGVLGGERASVAIPAKQEAHLDRQLRGELFAALVEVAPADTDSAWVSRPGAAVLDARDTGWLLGAEDAFGAAGLALSGFYAITREGWLDVRTGERRVWRRLRLNR